MFLPIGDDVEQRSLPVIGTYLIIANLIVFAYEMRLLFDAADPRFPKEFIDFITTWGLVPLDIQKERYTGIFTHMFLHGNFSHILGNMFALWAFVRSLENALGAFNFLFFYVFWGLIAAVAQTMMNWGSDIPCVGASGAIAGMMGAYFVAFGFRTKIRTLVWFFGRPTIYQIPASTFVVFWAAMQVIGAVGAHERGETAGVAWYAHIGGFVAGIVTMSLVARNTQKRLVRTMDGELQFEDAAALNQQKEQYNAASPMGVAAQMAIQQGEAQQEQYADEPPDACPHCGTEFPESSKLSGNLLQCTNPACKRLTYLH